MEKISAKELEQRFQKTKTDEWKILFDMFMEDERAAIQKVIIKYQKQLDALDKETKRLQMMLSFERECYEQGYELVCGIDEAGRGPLAGPVVAGAVIMPKNHTIFYVNDSKKLSEKKREELFEQINEQCISVGVGIVSPKRIDEINILQATYEAMRQAVASLNVVPDILLNDAVTIPKITIPQRPIVKGDAKSHSIACASIIAKVTRDRMMQTYDEIYPAYGFAKHKGYGSAMHYEALKTYGPCPIHRLSFDLKC